MGNETPATSYADGRTQQLDIIYKTFYVFRVNKINRLVYVFLPESFDEKMCGVELKLAPNVPIKSSDL